MTARNRPAAARAAALILACAGAARAGTPGDEGVAAPAAIDPRSAELRFDPPEAREASAEPDPAGTESPAERPAISFGNQGDSFVSAGLGIAYNFNDAVDTEVSVGYSIFLIDEVEFKVDVRFFYFIQDGDDAAGINPIMYFRWHFLDREEWTLYTDLGIGLLFATDNVPDGGSGFDFTPTVGFGMTRLLDESSGLRLDAGARWFHISNARIEGDVSNPSRDALMVYAGLMIPFR